MSLREWSSKHPRLSATAGGLCLALVVGAVGMEILGGRHHITTLPPFHYYSVDDGKTFFTASQSNIPPFDYEGKTAVRACVFNCGDHLFVGYLERYTTDAREKEMGSQRGSAELELNGREVKKPGDSIWSSSSDRPALIRVTSVACPGGSSDIPMPVEPE